MKTILTAAALALAAAPAFAQDDVELIAAAGDVAATMDALAAAVEGAGATVFARIDHGQGARDVGADIGESQLLVFGNPQLGTPAMQEDRLAGLFLPLKVLVYEDAEGQVWLAFQNPEEALDDLDIDDDAEFIDRMQGALDQLTAAAAQG